jgi:hypothetical protein
MEKARFQDLCIGILVLIVSAVAYAGALEMPEDTQVYTNTVIALFAFLGSLLIVFSLVNRNKPGGAALSVNTIKNPAITVVFVAVYLALITVLGFYFSSVVFLVTYMLFLGARKPKSMAIAIVGMLTFIYFVFTVQLKVPLPRGIFF